MSVDELLEKYDNGEIDICGVSYAGAPVDHTVMYVTKKVEHLLSNLKGHTGCVAFVEDSISIDDNGIFDGNHIILVSNPQYEYAKMATEIERQRKEKDKTLKFTLTEEGYYIGEDTTIGEDSYIEPGCFIGHHVTIGDHAVVLSGARITNSIIGDNFVCNENAVIGSNSFTMAEDENGNKYRIPALGKVVIGNNVEIGACDNISRGESANTLIDDYAKVDVLVHIGHDAHLHKNVEIAAGGIVGGFVEIHEHSYIGINSAIRNRKILGENCVIGMGSVVVKNIDESITVVGNPAKKLIKEK